MKLLIAFFALIVLVNAETVVESSVKPNATVPMVTGNNTVLPTRKFLKWQNFIFVLTQVFCKMNG